jgi:hypothetical protein
MQDQSQSNKNREIPLFRLLKTINNRILLALDSNEQDSLDSLLSERASIIKEIKRRNPILTEEEKKQAEDSYQGLLNGIEAHLRKTKQEIVLTKKATALAKKYQLGAVK